VLVAPWAKVDKSQTSAAEQIRIFEVFIFLSFLFKTFAYKLIVNNSIFCVLLKLNP
jgi:hypothetical protein